MVTVPLASIIIGITYVFMFHIRCISTARSLYFRKNFGFSPYHTCLLQQHCLLAGMVLFHYHALRRPVHCQEWFCQFALDYSMTWLAYLNGLFLLILVHAHASVRCTLHYTVYFIVIITIIIIIIIILDITFM